MKSITWNKHAFIKHAHITHFKSFIGCVANYTLIGLIYTFDFRFEGWLHFFIFIISFAETHRILVGMNSEVYKNTISKWISQNPTKTFNI